MSSQTSDSLWGLTQVPIFDASVNTNAELVSAAINDLELEGKIPAGQLHGTKGTSMLSTVIMNSPS